MKKHTFTLSLVGALIGIFVLGGCTTYPSKLSVYPFNTAVIQYELSGSTEGDMTVYIRGDQKAVHKFITTAGQEGNTFELDLGSEKYIADLDKMTAVKISNSDYEELISMSAEEQERFLIRKELGLKESTEVPESLITAVVAGQTCNVYQIPNLGTACIWSGVVLQKEISMLDVTNKITAVSVETNVSIPEERFELPAGILVK